MVAKICQLEITIKTVSSLVLFSDLKRFSRNENEIQKIKKIKNFVYYHVLTEFS